MTLRRSDSVAATDVWAVVAWFLARDAAEGLDADVSPMKLQKLLYLSQANYLASTGTRLFDCDFLAYEHGPVVREVWKRYQGVSSAIVLSDQAPPVTPELSADVAGFLQRVWVHWGGMSASTLRNLTHGQRPWLESYHDGVRDTVIPDELMLNYFLTEAPKNQRIRTPSAHIGAHYTGEPIDWQLPGVSGSELSVPSVLIPVTIE